MKQAIFISIISLLTLGCLNSFGQKRDTVKTHLKTSVKIDTVKTINSSVDSELRDDFAPALFFGALVAFGVVLACVAAGITLIVLSLLLLLGMVSFGILSASVIVGLYNRSLTKGFKTFIFLSSTIGGAASCGMLFLLLNQITHWYTNQNALITGVVCGAFAGVAFGFLAYYVITQLTNYLKIKLNLA